MQRTKQELEQMSHDELVNRVLEMQDMLREGLAVRDALHKVLNNLLKAKADEVERYAALAAGGLGPDEQAVKDAWAKARHAVSNPSGLAWMIKKTESTES